MCCLEALRLLSRHPSVVSTLGGLGLHDILDSIQVLPAMYKMQLLVLESKPQPYPPADPRTLTKFHTNDFSTFISESSQQLIFVCNLLFSVRTG